MADFKFKREVVRVERVERSILDRQFVFAALGEEC
jgi:hypothetical protein